MSTTAITGSGTVFKIGNGATPTEVFTPVAEVTDHNGGGVTLGTVDATHTESGDYDDFIPTSFKNDDWTFTINYVPGGAAETAILAALEAKAFKNYQIVYPNDSFLQCNGLMTKWTPGGITKDGKMSAAFSIMPRGAQTRPE